MTKISMIAAMANNRVIGNNNEMPWYLPADLKHFKSVTLGKPVIMGRNTYESIGKALPGRKNIVVTRNQAYSLSDAIVVNDCDSALRVASTESSEIMIMGGGKIYEAFLPKADQLFLTFINADIKGDTYFPDYLKSAHWNEIAREVHEPDEKNQHQYEFVTLVRKPS